MTAHLWHARPTAVTLIAATGALRNLADDALAVSDEYANGTNLHTHADVLLYLHDFAAAPDTAGHCELHLIPELDSTYADGEDGDAASPRLLSNTLLGIIPVSPDDDAQPRALTGLPLPPHDFRLAIVNRTGQAIADSDGSTLTLYPYHMASS